MPITTFSHKLVTPANNHGIISARLGPYADVTARRLEVLTGAHKGLVAEQLSDHSLWVVVFNGTGYSWGPLCAGPEAVGSALFGIMGAEPSWWIDGIASTIVDAGGGIASSATDASGHGFDATFTSTHRPSIITSGLSGHPTLRFSSSQYGGNSSFTAAAPGTTSQYFFMVVKSATLAASSIFLGTSAGGNLYVGAANKVNDFNAGAGPISDVMTAGTWYILEALRTNQATDYVQLNGTGGTVGASAGNNAQTAYMLNATTAGAQINDCEYATAFEYNLATPPTPTQRANMRAWARSVWPAIP